MATYSCDCGKPADWFFREVGPDGRAVPMGRSWAACNQHAARALPSMIGPAWKVSPVSRTWEEHVARRRREGSSS
jgi:hypothetical protein